SFMDVTLGEPPERGERVIMRLDSKSGPLCCQDMSVDTAPFDAPQRFRQLLEQALRQKAFVRLTLGGYIGPDKTVKNLVVRPVLIRGEARLSFVHRHATRDITQNHPPAEALEILQAFVGVQFRHAHLFTIHHTAELRY